MTAALDGILMNLTQWCSNVINTCLLIFYEKHPHQWVKYGAFYVIPAQTHKHSGWSLFHGMCSHAIYECVCVLNVTRNFIWFFFFHTLNISSSHFILVFSSLTTSLNGVNQYSDVKSELDKGFTCFLVSDILRMNHSFGLIRVDFVPHIIRHVQLKN